MGIKELRQKARLEAAEQAEQAEHGRALATERSRPRLKLAAFSPRQIIRHPRFVAILTLWGAVVLGLCALVLSSVDIARINMVLGLGALGSLAKIVYAAIAAVIGGASAFIAATMIVRFAGRASRKGPIATMAAERVRPIDPAEDLGSESLDAPIEEIPFAAALPDSEALGEDETADTFEDRLEEPSPIAGLDDALRTGGDSIDDTNDESDVLELDTLNEVDAPSEPDLELTDEGVNDGEPEAEPIKAALDIDAFVAIMKEEALRIEGYQTQEREEGATAGPAPDLANATTTLKTSEPASVAKLREVPPQELSLVQLVERFAAALHDAQRKHPSQLATDQITRENVKRERALSEALKALEVLTANGFDSGNLGAPVTASQQSGALPQPVSKSAGQTRSATVNETERNLRNALTKLQNQRGAA